MRGMAEGAGVEVEDILLINARTEILKLAGRSAAGRGAEEADGCTGAVLLPEATRDGALVHGQNWDWKIECAETGVVLKVRREDGPDYLTFTSAGGLARSGLNAPGHAITANNPACDHDYCHSRVPLDRLPSQSLASEH